MAAAVIGVLAVVAAAFFVAPAVRSVVAGPDAGAPAAAPTPVGHEWSQVEGHGAGTSLWWLGTTADQTLELRVNSVRALRLEPNATSPNLIGGFYGNSVTAGAYGAAIGGGGVSGYGNSVTDNYGTVGGGANNQAGNGAGTTSDRTYATVGGGATNTASGSYATVGGGATNTASGSYTTVGGGSSNTASGLDATVGGGATNTASAANATVGGGAGNDAIASYATVGGGYGNTASADYATIAGGGRSDPGDPATRNRVTDNYCTVGGGGNNQAGDNAGTTADRTYATVGGGLHNLASGQYATVGGGHYHTASGDSATVGGGWFNGASGILATVGGGWGNLASGERSTVGGGSGNGVTDNYATVGGGYTNLASALYATVGGGQNNTASADYATIAGGGRSDPGSDATANRVTDNYGTVGGGGNNQAGNGGFTDDKIYATVGGGVNNTASGQSATVAGGQNNTASGQYATVAGGTLNSASGNYSFAAGRRAKASDTGSFVWADSTDADFSIGGNNRFSVRATGGVYLRTSSDGSTSANFDASGAADFQVNNNEYVFFYDNGVNLISTSTGARLTIGGTWTNASSRDQKENFTPVDGQAVLASLADMPITTWNSKAEDPSIRHMGPVAQDFYAAFGLGGSDTSIGTLDADGVALAAIQGLYGLSQDQAARIQALEEENAGLQQRLDDLEARVTALEGGAGTSGASAGPLSSAMPAGWLLLGGLVVGGLVVVQRRRAGGRR
jgi:hypothetical protein